MAGVSVSAGWATGATTRGNAGRPVNKLSLSPNGMRLVIGASVAFALAASLGVLPGGLGASASSAQSSSETAAHKVETVRDGDSLWAIAQRTMPGDDVMGAVDQLRVLNGGAALRLHPGQTVLIP